MKQVLGAIRYFHLKVLNENPPESLKINLRKPIYLPVVLLPKEVNKIINLTENLKHKTILRLVYSAKLRLGELLSLRIADIDSQALKIHIKQGKGKSHFLHIEPISFIVYLFFNLAAVKYKRSAGLEALHFQFNHMFVNIQFV